MVERLAVAQKAAGSIPVGHPNLRFGHIEPRNPFVLSGFYEVLTVYGAPGPRARTSETTRAALRRESQALCPSG